MSKKSNGWGLNTMLIAVGIFFIALLVIAFYAIRLNAYLDKQNNDIENKLEQKLNNVKNEYYDLKIKQINQATLAYIRDYNIILDSSYTKIDIDTLISSGYLNKITDYDTKKECFGYSLTYKDTNNSNIVNSYIKCDNYKSKGYGEY